MKTIESKKVFCKDCNNRSEFTKNGDYDCVTINKFTGAEVTKKCMKKNKYGTCKDYEDDLREMA